MQGSARHCKVVEGAGRHFWSVFESVVQLVKTPACHAEDRGFRVLSLPVRRAAARSDESSIGARGGSGIRNTCVTGANASRRQRLRNRDWIVVRKKVSSGMTPFSTRPTPSGCPCQFSGMAQCGRSFPAWKRQPTSAINAGGPSLWSAPSTSFREVCSPSTRKSIMICRQSSRAHFFSRSRGLDDRKREPERYNKNQVAILADFSIFELI